MTMIISFPDSAPSATQFSGAAARPESASSVKSQAISAGTESAACPERKSENSKDDDFESMLAFMMGSAAAPMQLPDVAESTQAAPAGTSLAQGIASSSASTTSQNTVKDLNVSTSEVLGEINGPESPGNTGETAGTHLDTSELSSRRESLNNVGWPFQSVPARVSQPDTANGIEFLPTGPATFRPPVSNDTGMPELQVTAQSVSLAGDSDLSVLPEALPQAAIDALDRIGRSPDSEISPSVLTTEQVSNASISTTLETLTDDSKKLSLAATSEPAPTSKAGAIAEAPGFPVAGGSSELIVNSAGAQSSSPKALTIRDESAIRPRVESHIPVAAASDIVRGDMTQSNVAPALTDLPAAVLSEMPQPLSNQVSQTIMAHVERNGARTNDTLSVRLDPPELGEMTIQLSKTHEGLAVRVTAREVVTMDMLFARGQEIESHLRSQQMNLKSLVFLHDMSGHGFSQGHRQNDTLHRAESLLRSGHRSSNVSIQADSGSARRTTPESSHSLSFRA